jgi:hypothetical protein
MIRGFEGTMAFRSRDRRRVMKISTFIAGAALSLAAGLASAQPITAGPPKTTIVCLDVAGRSLPVTCRAPASRIDPHEDICQCNNLGVKTVISICPAGVSPPPDSADYENARRLAAKNGSLVGATYKGRPMCVLPRQERY